MTILLAILLSLQADAASKKAAEVEASGDFLKAAKAWAVAKGYPAKERMAACLEKAWTTASEADRPALRAKLLQFTAPPKDYQKPGNANSQAAGWWSFSAEDGSSVDSRFAWTGTKSLKMVTCKRENGWSSAHTLHIPLKASKRVTASVWIFAYETDAGGHLNIYFDDMAGTRISGVRVPILGDIPVWKRYEVSADVPQGAALAIFRVDVKIVKGAIWCDEVTFTDGARDLFMGGGFER